MPQNRQPHCAHVLLINMLLQGLFHSHCSMINLRIYADIFCFAYFFFLSHAPRPTFLARHTLTPIKKHSFMFFCIRMHNRSHFSTWIITSSTNLGILARNRCEYFENCKEKMNAEEKTKREEKTNSIRTHACADGYLERRERKRAKFNI